MNGKILLSFAFLVASITPALADRRCVNVFWSGCRTEQSNTTKTLVRIPTSANSSKSISDLPSIIPATPSSRTADVISSPSFSGAHGSGQNSVGDASGQNGGGGASGQNGGSNVGGQNNVDSGSQAGSGSNSPATGGSGSSNPGKGNSNGQGGSNGKGNAGSTGDNNNGLGNDPGHFDPSNPGKGGISSNEPTHGSHR